MGTKPLSRKNHNFFIRIYLVLFFIKFCTTVLMNNPLTTLFHLFCASSLYIMIGRKNSFIFLQCIQLEKNESFLCHIGFFLFIYFIFFLLLSPSPPLHIYFSSSLH